MFRDNPVILLLLTLLLAHAVRFDLVNEEVARKSGKELVINKHKVNLSFKLVSNFFPLDINEYNNIVNVEQSYIEERRLSCSLDQIQISALPPVEYSQLPTPNAFWDYYTDYLYVFNTEFEMYHVTHVDNKAEFAKLRSYPELTSFFLSNPRLQFARVINHTNEDAQIILMYTINSICVLNNETNTVGFVLNAIDESNIIATFFSYNIGDMIRLFHIYNNLNNEVTIIAAQLALDNLPNTAIFMSPVVMPGVTLDPYLAKMFDVALAFTEEDYSYVFVVSTLTGIRGFVYQEVGNLFNLTPVLAQPTMGNAIYKVGSLIITFLNNYNTKNSVISIFKMAFANEIPLLTPMTTLDVGNTIDKLSVTDTHTVYFSTSDGVMYELNVDLFLFSDDLYTALFSKKYATKQLSIGEHIRDNFSFLGSFVSSPHAYIVLLTDSKVLFLQKDKQNLKLSCQREIDINSYSLANYIVYSTSIAEPSKMFMSYVNIMIYDSNEKKGLNVIVLIVVGLLYILGLVLFGFTVRVFCWRKKEPHVETIDLDDSEQVPSLD